MVDIELVSYCQHLLLTISDEVNIIHQISWRRILKTRITVKDRSIIGFAICEVFCLYVQLTYHDLTLITSHCVLFSHALTFKPVSFILIGLRWRFTIHSQKKRFFNGSSEWSKVLPGTFYYLNQAKTSPNYTQLWRTKKGASFSCEEP